MYYVYILRCSNDTLYTGITNNLQQRMAQHRSGNGSKYVRAHLPFILEYLERKSSKSLALKREIEIKNLSREQKLILIKTSKIINK